MSELATVVRARELQDRLDELRAAVELAVAEHERGLAPERIFGRLRRELEHVPAGRWSEQVCIEKAQEWNARFGEPPAALDWNPARAKADGHPELAERWAQGDWPSLRTIVRLFVRWNLFLEAAGFEVRAGPEDLSAAGGRIDYDGFPVWTGWTLLAMLRKRAGLSQQELAARMGTTHGYVGLMERGVKTNPTVRTVLALAQAFGIGPGALMTHEPAEAPPGDGRPADS